MNNTATSNGLHIYNVFAGLLTIEEIDHRARHAGLWLTDCLSDEQQPCVTIAVEEDGQPVWTLTQMGNGKFILTDTDTDELPPLNSVERGRLADRIQAINLDKYA